MSSLEQDFLSTYANLEELRSLCRKRIPRFAFEYLDGGCNECINLAENTADIRKIRFVPRYIGDYAGANLRTSLFGVDYDAPFGVAPVGLQGMMWPGSTQILARAARRHNVPFVLSTMSTADMETVSQLTDGNFWFQLYYPANAEHREDLIRRAQNSGCDTLVLLIDVPTFGYRPLDMRNGLSMPPRMNMRNIIQALSRPRWSLHTLRHGIPAFKNLTPYMTKATRRNLKQLGQFMNATFSGRLTRERIAPIRDMWKGNLVLKGVASREDFVLAQSVGFDGVIVSNHGGRQLDAGESSIHALARILSAASNSNMKIMLDSGIRSGADIPRCLAKGADFVFLGRTFMYGVGALGAAGGNHVMAALKKQIQQLMEQIGCEDLGQLADFLADAEGLHRGL